MAQKDYVGRAKRGTQKRNTNSRSKSKKQHGSSAMILLLIVIVAAFAGGLYFLKYGKPTTTKPDSASATINKSDKNIPPAPPKRWVYIDALVNPGQHNQTNNDGANTPTGMTAEQLRILSLMASDRPKTAADTSSTYNQQVDRNSQNDQKPATTTQQPTTTNQTTTTGQNTNQTVQQPTITKPTSQSWLLQCGAFRNKEGAESVKAQIALAGLGGQINYSNNLYRVIVGPYATKEQASKAQNQIRNSGITSCHIRG